MCDECYCLVAKIEHLEQENFYLKYDSRKLKELKDFLDSIVQDKTTDEEKVLKLANYANI
jgi:hypothetical protein